MSGEPSEIMRPLSYQVEKQQHPRGQKWSPLSSLPLLSPMCTFSSYLSPSLKNNKQKRVASLRGSSAALTCTSCCSFNSQVSSERDNARAPARFSGASVGGWRRAVGVGRKSPVVSLTSGETAININQGKKQNKALDYMVKYNKSWIENNMLLIA